MIEKLWRHIVGRSDVPQQVITVGPLPPGAAPQEVHINPPYPVVEVPSANPPSTGNGFCLLVVALLLAGLLVVCAGLNLLLGG